MEEFIRDQLPIVSWENEDGSVEDSFEYVDPYGFSCKTKLSAFLNSQSEFRSLIDYWKEQGLPVPQ